MDAADREKTAFVTQGGLYEFRVMPFEVERSREVREANGMSTARDRLVGMFIVPG